MSIKKTDTLHIINNNLKKYNESIKEYYKTKAKNLMFHKKTHFTAIFTEYLIMDDNQEFLNEYYLVDKSLTYLLILIKIQCHKFFSPVLVNNWGRKILSNNIKRKILLLKFLSEKSKDATENKSKLLTNQKEFSNILPSDLSENTNTVLDKNEFNIADKGIFINNCNLKTKENIESESSTIDNVNANNDISISLDFKINPKYEDKLLNQNMNFIEDKNGNDEEVVKILKYLKPINTVSLYKKNNLNKNTHNNNYQKQKNNLLYLFYLNNNNNKSSSKKHRDNEILSPNNQIKNHNPNQNSKNKFSHVNYNNNTNSNNIHRSILLNTQNTYTSNVTKRKNKSKNTSLSGNHAEIKNPQSKKNNCYYSHKYSTHINTNRYDANIINKSPNTTKNICSIYSDHIINKTINSKLNNNDNINDKYQKKIIINQRNQENNKILIPQNYSELKILSSHCNFKSEKDKLIENSDSRTKSSKYIKTNKKIILDRHSVDNSNFNAKTQLKSNSNSTDKTINLSKINFIKPGLSGNDYKNLKKIIGKKKTHEISPDVNDKNRLFLKYKYDNSDILTKTTKEKKNKQDKQQDYNQNRVIECHIIKKKNSKKDIIVSKRKISEDLEIREYK